jgi:hypothetical protein
MMLALTPTILFIKVGVTPRGVAALSGSVAYFKSASELRW